MTLAVPLVNLGFVFFALKNPELARRAKALGLDDVISQIVLGSLGLAGVYVGGEKLRDAHTEKALIEGKTNIAQSEIQAQSNETMTAMTTPTADGSNTAALILPVEEGVVLDMENAG